MIKIFNLRILTKKEYDWLMDKQSITIRKFLSMPSASDKMSYLDHCIDIYRKNKGE